MNPTITFQFDLLTFTMLVLGLALHALMSWRSAYKANPDLRFIKFVQDDPVALPIAIVAAAILYIGLPEISRLPIVGQFTGVQLGFSPLGAACAGFSSSFVAQKISAWMAARAARVAGEQ